MADYLFATWEGGGNVPPTLAAVQRLVARGHTVRVIGDAVLAPEMRAAGADFTPWRTAPNRHDRRPESDYLRDWEPTEPGAGLLRLLDRLTIGAAAAHAADTLAELQRAPADAVVSTDILFGPMLAAEAAGTPLAVLGANVSIVPIEGMPPLGPGLMPPTTEEERAMAEGVAAWFAAALAERLPVLNAARAGLGLAPVADALEPVRRAQLILMATSRAFDFPVAALPANTRYVGPLHEVPAWAPRGWASPWPQDDTRPLVLVALSSTFQDQAGAIQAVLDAAVGLPVRIVVTLGPALAGTAFRAPENALVLDEGDHEALTEAASVVVTHCGHGTVMRALRHGCAVLGLPMGRDQNDNAARIVAHGAGLRLAPDAGAEAIRGALATLLAEPRFSEAAARLGAEIATSEPRDALVEALEALVARPACRCAA